MRYFYTDPLAAAWMARHFGMKFEPELFSGPVYTVPGIMTYTVHAVKEEDTITLPQKFCVHIDSFWILEPQIGDMLIYDDPGEDEMGLVTDNKLVLELNRHRKIIQRNNIPFMYPECEE